MSFPFSVVICTYNRPMYLLQALQSVYCQSFRDFQVVIVDDGSDERTRRVCEMFGFNGRLIYHRQEHAGIPVARNVGVHLALGEYVVICDDDDIQFPRRVELHHQAIREGYIGSYGGWIDFDPDGNLVENPGKEPHSLGALLYTGRVLCHGVSCIRRDILLANPYNEALPYGSDYELAVRIAAAGHKMAHVGDHVMLRRLHNGNVTTTDREQQRQAARDAVRQIIAAIPTQEQNRLRSEARKLPLVNLRSPF